MKKNYLFLGALIAIFLCALQVQATVINVSDSIKNNDFSGDIAKWTVTYAGYSGIGQLENTYEAYNASNGSSWFNCVQSVTLPAGVYRLSAGAFHRSGNAYTNVILYGNTTKKEYSVAVKTLASETATYGSTPSSRVAAKTAFDAGSWINTVDNIVVENELDGKGTLNVGIRNICQPPLSSGSIWTIWSNFKLYKLEGADLDPLRDAVVASATSLIAEVTDYNDGGVLSNATTTLSSMLDADLTDASINDLKIAMTTYRNNRIAATTYAKPSDVTHLIANPGFEDGQVSVLGTANGHYNQPKGWMLTYNAAATHTNNNVTIIDNKVVPAGLATVYTLSPSEGNYLFQSRFRWTANETMTISQTVPSLVAGTYTLSADLGKTSANGTSFFKGMLGTSEVMNVASTNTTTTGTSLTNVSSTFYANAGDNLIISAVLKQVGGEATILLDNIKLKYWGSANVTANKNVLSNVQVFPTVTDGSVNVTLDGNSTIKLFDVAGRLILNRNSNAGVESISLPTSGLFFVEVSSSNTTKTVKVIRVK